MPYPAGGANNSEVESTVLERLNSERAAHFLAAVIWLILLIVVGIVGNGLVLYVFMRYFKQTSSNYFIMTLAIFDLVACLIAMPLEIYDLLHPLTFFSEFGCKFLRAMQNFTIFGSVVVLVEIAFDRYFKICRPLTFISIFKIKVLCAVAGAVGALFSIPSFLFFGIKRIDTSMPGIRGYDCSISDTYNKTTILNSYYISLSTIFMLISVIMIVLYVRVWMALRQRRWMGIGGQLNNPRDCDDNMGASIKKVLERSDNEEMEARTRSNSRIDASLYRLSPDRVSITSGTSTYISLAKRPVSRTTIMLFVVTLAFVLSFLPALAIMIFRTVVKKVNETKSTGSHAAMTLFLKFNYINNSINPIIYSFLNINFRHQARLALGSCKTQRKQDTVSIKSKPNVHSFTRSPKLTPVSTETVESFRAVFFQNPTLTSKLTPSPTVTVELPEATFPHNSTCAPSHPPTTPASAESSKNILSEYSEAMNLSSSVD